MEAIVELLDRLNQAKNDPHAQSAIAAEFAITSRSPEENASLREALDAAAVLRCFDATLLRQVLQLTPEDATRRCRWLTALSFVERFPAPGRDLYNVHEATRLGWRKRMAMSSSARFRELSAAAAGLFETDPTPGGRIEWIYHRLGAEPDQGATDLERLNRDWSGRARPEERHSLAAAVGELRDTGLVSGRALVWVCLVVAWARSSRGESSRLGPEAKAARSLAIHVGDRRAEADALCLLGDVLQAQGKLKAAQVAIRDFLEISEDLARQSPGDESSQRELALAHSRMGDVLQARKRLEDAHRHFEASLEIVGRLAEQDPKNAGRQRELAIAHNRVGGAWEARGRLDLALLAFEKDLAISQSLADEDPQNAGWQRDLAVTHGRVGQILEAQDELDAAHATFKDALSISRRLAEKDPANAGWQQDLALAHGRMGDVLKAQGRMEEARSSIAECVAISRKLACLDPTNAGWQHDYAIALGKMGGLLRMAGKLDDAGVAFTEGLEILDRLRALDPSNTQWKEDLEVAEAEASGLAPSRPESPILPPKAHL